MSPPCRAREHNPIRIHPILLCALLATWGVGHQPASAADATAIPTLAAEGFDQDQLALIVTEGLDAAQPERFETALQALLQLPGATTLNRLEAVRLRLADPDADPAILTAAAAFVGTVGDDLAIDLLIDLLAEDAPIAAAARKALAAVTLTDQGPQPQAWRNWYRSWLEAETAVIPTLRTQLEETDPERQKLAIRQLRLLASHRHSVGQALAGSAAQPGELQDLAADALRGLGGVAALHLPSATVTPTATLLDPQAALAESGRRELPTPSEAEPAGLRRSQLITLAICGGAVVLLALGFGYLCWRHPGKTRAATDRIAKKIGEHTARITKNAKRITFTK